MTSGNGISPFRTATTWSLAIAALCLAGAPQARADVTTYALQLQNVTVTGDGMNPATGFIEVFFSYDFTPLNLIAYNLDFSAPTAVTFDATGATTLTVDNGFLFPLTADLDATSDSTAHHIRAAADVYDTDGDGLEPLPGHGLLRVPFSVAAGQFGTFNVTFGPQNALTNVQAHLELFNTFDGSITVNAAAVPEAAAWAQLGVGIALVGVGLAATRLRSRIAA